MELTVRVADTLLVLLTVGHVNYSRFHRKYYRLAEKVTLCAMERHAKELEVDLTTWNVQVEALRSEYYEFNYYTSRQLSLICQQLSTCARNTSLIESWFKTLLLSICPLMVEEEVLRAAKDVAYKKDRTQERKMLNLDQHVDEQEDSIMFVSSEGTGSGDKPSVTKDDLSETWKEIFDFMCDTMEFSEAIVLRGLTELGPNSDDVLDYCLKGGVSEVTLAERESSREDMTQQHSPAESHADSPLVLNMTNEGYTIKLVKKAIEECGEDEENVASYCLENEATFVPEVEAVGVSSLPGDHK